MELSKQIMICKVSPKWLKIIRSEYLVSGSLDSCFWSIDKKSSELTPSVKNFAPGDVVIYICQDGDELKIVGGGFFIGWNKISVSKAWESFGVRNGVTDLDDFISEVEEHGGNKKSNLIAATLGNNFIFDKNSVLNIPDEVSSHFKSGLRFVLSTDDPTGRYLSKIVKRLYDEEIERFGYNWQGIYYLASRSHFRSYAAGFYARVRAAYNFTCAISGNNSAPLLEVAQIRPFYDFNEQTANNGILMRSDFHRLFSLGYFTLVYENENKLVMKMSPCLKSVGGESYLAYDGKEITLPKDKEKRPSPENLEWHRNTCYEHWLRMGGSAIA